MNSSLLEPHYTLRISGQAHTRLGHVSALLTYAIPRTKLPSGQTGVNELACGRIASYAPSLFNGRRPQRSVVFVENVSNSNRFWSSA